MSLYSNSELQKYCYNRFMTTEDSMGRRQFLATLGRVALAVGFAGQALTESRENAEVANYRKLREFIDASISSNPDELGQATANFLGYVGRPGTPPPARPQVRWFHNAKTIPDVDDFIIKPEYDVVELDIRFNELEERLYVGHDRSDHSDIDPIDIYGRVVDASKHKTLKYDFKEPEAARRTIQAIDPDMPCVLNADLLENAGFGMTPQEFVDISEHLQNSLISIGIRGGGPSYNRKTISEFMQLAKNNPGREFILTANLISFMSSIDLLKEVLELPNTSLMMYRTADLLLTEAHVDSIIKNFDPAKRPGLLQGTYFDP